MSRATTPGQLTQGNFQGCHQSTFPRTWERKWNDKTQTSCVATPTPREFVLLKSLEYSHCALSDAFHSLFMCTHKYIIQCAKCLVRLHTIAAWVEQLFSKIVDSQGVSHYQSFEKKKSFSFSSTETQFNHKHNELTSCCSIISALVGHELVSVAWQGDIALRSFNQYIGQLSLILEMSKGQRECVNNPVVTPQVP